MEEQLRKITVDSLSRLREFCAKSYHVPRALAVLRQVRMQQVEGDVNPNGRGELCCINEWENDTNLMEGRIMQADMSRWLVNVIAEHDMNS